MALTYLWHATRALITFGLAAAALAKSDTGFQAFAFLAALIAYHRLTFTQSQMALSQVTRAVRDELWVHRLDRLLQSAGADRSTLPAVLHVELQGGEEGLEMLSDDLNLVKRKHRAFGVSEAVIEVGLTAALVLALLS